ncbi:MAG TPA: hypothetical protein VFV57_07125 [Limnobacter sp.]|nr:hypothetical protein [Limnobacter sp.]
MLSFLLSISLGFSAIGLDDLPAERVEQIAKVVMADLQQDMRVKPSLIVTERPEPTPLGAITYANGKCVVIININTDAWSQWGRFLNQRNTSDWDGIVAASVAHEMGHCLRESRDFVNTFEVDDKQFSGLRNTGGLGAAPEMVYKQELFADTVAMIYASEKTGDRAVDVMQAMVHARARYGANDPTHNTSEIMERLLAKPLIRQPDESMGKAAMRLLKAL